MTTQETLLERVLRDLRPLFAAWIAEMAGGRRKRVCSKRTRQSGGCSRCPGRVPPTSFSGCSRNLSWTSSPDISPALVGPPTLAADSDSLCHPAKCIHRPDALEAVLTAQPPCASEKVAKNVAIDSLVPTRRSARETPSKFEAWSTPFSEALNAISLCRLVRSFDRRIYCSSAVHPQYRCCKSS